MQLQVTLEDNYDSSSEGEEDDMMMTHTGTNTENDRGVEDAWALVPPTQNHDEHREIEIAPLVAEPKPHTLTDEGLGLEQIKDEPIKDESVKDEPIKDESVKDELLVLPVGSFDSIPTNFTALLEQSPNRIFVKKEPLLVETEKKEEPIGTSAPIINNRTKRCTDIANVVLKDWRFLVLLPICILTIYFAKTSYKKQLEIERLRLEINDLTQALLQKETSKLSYGDWINQGSEFLKDWTYSIVEFDNLRKIENETSYLDIWPDEALGKMRNMSSHMATLFGEVANEVGSSAKEAMSSVGEGFVSVGESVSSSVRPVTERFSSMSETMLDIINEQKYTLIAGAVGFKVYECYMESSC